jgi:hypothetical protein
MHNKLANSHLPASPYSAGQTVPVRELHADYREEILNHLLHLNDEDRRLRFGTQIPDEVIRHYVEYLNFNKDAIFGVFDLDLKLIGMAHLAYLPEHKKATAKPLNLVFQYCQNGAHRALGQRYCSVLPYILAINLH